LWGGRFNPIVIVDPVEDAEQIVELFRADVIIPIGASDAVNAFPKRFPHLISPFYGNDLFTGTTQTETRANVLDIHNALATVRDTPEWKVIQEKGLRLYTWDENDPLSDVFLMHLGAYPDAEDTRADYRELVMRLGEGSEQQIDPHAPVPDEIFEHPSASYLSRHGLQRHYGIHARRDHPGFYLGDAANLEDLVGCWNLRATDASVFFIDRNHLSRYQQLIPAWKKKVKELLAYRRPEPASSIAIWARRDTMSVDLNAHVAELQAIFGAEPFALCGIDAHLWNGLNLQAPMMILGECAQLGVLTDETGKFKLSFALSDKPFCGDTWFHTQHLVASVSFIGGLFGDDLHTLNPPYIPELNEFYARTIHFQYNKLRIEPESIGLVIDAADSDEFVYALSVADLFERIFRLAGYSARPSSGGLISRQIITQMDGLRGAAVFKIPGVRRLLKTYGPTDPFTQKAAVQLIGSRDPDNPTANFSDFEGLYIEARPHGTKLKPSDVFAYLVEKGLFRMGSLLTCPHCRMASWIALDVLKQRVICEMCGREFNATRQLVTGPCYYRRSGVLGAERNAQGSVPVILVLQQLQINFSHGLRNNMYTTSLDLVPESSTDLPECEVDFVWLVAGDYPKKTTVILGESKDRGRNRNGEDGGTIDLSDVSNLKAVADALPAKRFDTFVLLAKLCSFTPEEIDAAKNIGAPYHDRAILLTDRELEPWHIYERTKTQFKIDDYAGSAEALAGATAAIYFTRPTEPSVQPPEADQSVRT